MRLKYGLPLLASSLLAAIVLLPGCGSGNWRDNEDAPTRPKGKGNQPVSVVAKKRKPVAGEYKGTISGFVKFVGKKEDPAPLSFVTNDKAQDRDFCMKGTDYETKDQSVWVGDNGGLGNVYVWIEPEEGSYFKIPAEQLKEYAKGGPKAEVKITQPHCAFLPHCVALFSGYYDEAKNDVVESGQELVVLNDAKVAHTANVKKGTSSISNSTLGEGQKSRLTLSPNDIEYTVSCGTHGWMKGYIRAYEHPYAAITKVGEDAKAKKYEDKKDKDFGKYEIKGVPVGATVTLKVWHETIGIIATKKITLKEANPEDFEAGK